MEREILKLTRKEDGTFCIYEDGELAGSYNPAPDTFHIELPCKMWRHFNNILNKRLALISKS